jgi:hypothetical protein
VQQPAPRGFFHAGEQDIMTKRDVSRQESADDYPGVVAELGKWRVVECRDGEQWILQRKSGTWEARSFCRTSEALRRVVREHVGAVDLPDLPKWLAAPAGVRVDSGASEAHSPRPHHEIESHRRFWPAERPPIGLR